MATWLPVPGYPKYEVSDEGEVRRTRDQRPLKPTRDSYAQVGLGRARKVRIHTLVLEAFVGPRPEGQECRHINGNKQDNRLSNLAWGTYLENADDNRRLGVTQVGSKHHNAKLTEDDVRVIRASTELLTVLSDRYGVTKSVLSEVRNRKAWVHVP